MGGSVSFTSNADSPTEPGKKSILTTDIEGVSAEQLLEGIEKYIRDGKAVSGFESSVEIADKDGDILVTSSFQGDIKIFTLCKIDKAANQVEVMSFPGPAFYEKGVCVSSMSLKVLSEPVRIECWCNAHGARFSGPMVKGILDMLLAELDAKEVDTTTDTPSIDDSSKLSVVSGPIEGKAVDAESFLDAYKQIAIDKLSAVELPDGSLVVEAANLGGLGVTTYAKHMMSKDDNTVITHEYATDADMQDVHAVTTLKAHKNPFRLEMWREDLVARRAGNDELKLVQPLVEGVLKAMAS